MTLANETQRCDVVNDWTELPDGWRFNQVTAVAVDDAMAGQLKTVGSAVLAELEMTALKISTHLERRPT